jgi:tight adherence protein C
MNLWITLFAFVGTSFLLILVFLVLNRDSFRISARTRGLGRAAAPGRSLADSIREALVRLPFGAALLGRGAARQSRLRQQFARAGIYNPHAPAILLTIKVLLASAAAALVVVIGLAGLLSPMYALTAGLVATGLGVIAPGLWLDSRVARWQGALRRGLPDAMDMLVLCLEGGASLAASFQQLLQELRAAHPELGIEMDIVQHEIMLGKTSGEAMQTFGQRSGLEEVRTLASVLLQNERYGVSVAKALRIHADFMRQQRQQRAEETAQKAAVKILFPTVLCIFPAMFIVILGPAALRIMAVFARMK